MREEDVVRYAKEMQQFREFGYFVNSDGVKSTMLTKKGKKVKDFKNGTIMPKKPNSAYVMYFKDYHLKNKREADEAP